MTVDAAVVAATPAPVRRRRLPTADRVKEAILAYALLLPALVVLGVFTYFPFVRTFDVAQYKSAPYPNYPTPYQGPHQFFSVITSSTFLDSLRSTAIFVVIAVPIGIFLGLALAVFANQKLKGMAGFQVIFSSTAVSSVVVAAVIFLTILSPYNGLMQWLGIDTSPGIALSPSWAIEAVAGVQAWQYLGFSFIIMIAGLQSLPEEVIEAARMDGASTWKIFWRVIVPLMSPTIFFAAIVGMIAALQSFGAIDVLIGQGSVIYTHTNVIINSIFRSLTYDRNAGLAACLSIALFLITLLVTVAQFRVLNKRVQYGR